MFLTGCSLQQFITECVLPLSLCFPVPVISIPHEPTHSPKNTRSRPLCFAMLAIVGGSSLLGSSMFSALERREVPTSGGPVVVLCGPSLVFVQRHRTLRSQAYELPHDVRHAAIAEALAALGVTRVLGVASVGSLSARLPPGTVCVPHDYFNLWGVRSGLPDERAHIAPCYDEDTRSLVKAVVAEQTGMQPCDGVYVQTRGPRFETKAEVKFLATLGEVVGMTGADEATHMQERGLRYGALCMVDNWGNGVSPDFELSLEAFRQLVKDNEDTVQRLVAAVAAAHAAQHTAAWRAERELRE